MRRFKQRCAGRLDGPPRTTLAKEIQQHAVILEQRVIHSGGAVGKLSGGPPNVRVTVCWSGVSADEVPTWTV
jgi:hypothetical protein